MAEGKKKEKHRSPAYPAFGLETAIERARDFHEQQGKNYVNVASAKASWGSPSSGATGRILSTLLKFGLLEEPEGERGKGRKVGLSELGKKILFLKPENHPDRLKALREAALKPKIHQEMLEEWPSGLPPSDTTMENYLTVEREFNPNAVSPLIAEWRSTYEFAKLGLGGILSAVIKDNGDELPPVDPSTKREEGPMPETRREDSRPWDLTIPLIGGGQAILRAPIPLTKANFDHLKKVLEDSLANMEKAITIPEGTEDDT